MNRTDEPPGMENAKAARILVADDAEKSRRLLRDLLEVKGHEVMCAEDGQQAVEMALATLPDVVLLDVMMPKLDGYEVCRRLKADSRSAPIPILMITALVDRSDRIRGIDAGADDFVLKPFDREELLLRVRNAVCRKRLYDELQRKYQELRNMAELREGLTRMIDADNEVLSSLLRQRMPSEERAPVGLPGEATGRPPGGDDHGAH